MSFMLREKPEGGTNSLRGGKNSYSVKTKIGNWVEHEYKPGQHGRGFQSQQFRTNTQDAMEGGLVIAAPKFGAALPPPESDKMNYGNIVCPFKKETDKNWQSVTNTVHKRPDRNESNEFSTNFRLTGGMTGRQELSETRRRWIHDGTQAKVERYTTESQLAAAQSAPARYHARAVRRLPGVPLAVERAREALVELGRRRAAERPGAAGGVMAATRAALAAMDRSGDGRLGQAELAEGLRRAGVALGLTDAEQVFRYFDADGSGLVDVAELVAGVRGPFPEARQAPVEQAFGLVAGEEAESIALDALLDQMVASSHPDVLAGKTTPGAIMDEYRAQWPAYARPDDGRVDLGGFLEYYWDLSALVEVDDDFLALLRSAWTKLGGGGAWQRAAERKLSSSGLAEQQTVSAMGIFDGRKK